MPMQNIKTMRRDDWHRVTDKSCRIEDFSLGGQAGKISLLEIKKVSAPLRIDNGLGPITLADDHYAWVQLGLEGAFCWFTAMFDAQDRLIQIYVDMTDGNVTDTDDPWFADMYLDYALISGQVVELDRDELDQALEEEAITQAQYNRTLAEGEKVWKQLMQYGPQITAFFQEQYSLLKQKRR